MIKMYFQTYLNPQQLQLRLHTPNKEHNLVNVVRSPPESPFVVFAL